MSELRTGSSRVTPLRDGTLRLALGRTFPDVPAPALAALAAECPEAFAPGTWVAPVWCFLVRAGDRNVLVDTGNGGDLRRELAAAGVPPDGIGDVVYTHGHGDHVRGAALFRHAHHHLHEAEVPSVATMLDGLDLRPFRDDFDLAPGLRVLGAPGHTPGSAVVVVDGTCLLAGDTIHHPSLLRHPELRDGHDRDPGLARATRHRLLEWAARDGLVVGPAHFPTAFARVTGPAGGAFDWAAAGPGHASP
jgi:glyoxylase-like metal-dependent hydrolase (beta-lactamase superfamily II)